MITWMKNVNNFPISKVHPLGVAQHLLEFFNLFQPGAAYKSVAYTKSVYFAEKIWSGL